MQREIPAEVRFYYRVFLLSAESGVYRFHCGIETKDKHIHLESESKAVGESKVLVKTADIVISAVGKAGIIDGSCLREGQIILDVGISLNENGVITGDVDYKSAEKIVDAITPVPGGIGSVTTSVLMEHVVDAMIKKSQEKRK